MITATNVFAHIEDINSFCESIARLLTPDGFFVAEFPYLLDLIGNDEFDTIYHEHIFSLQPLRQLFVRHGLQIVDVERIKIHGGSLRLTAAKVDSAAPIAKSVEALLNVEAASVSGRAYYDGFAERVFKNLRELKVLIENLKAQKKRIVGYGASAKGTTLLNAAGLNQSHIDYLVDSIPEKQGRLAPGAKLEIFPEQKIIDDPPDCLLLLAWNFRDEILAKNQAFRDRGGRFIIPIPVLTIV